MTGEDQSRGSAHVGPRVAVPLAAISPGNEGSLTVPRGYPAPQVRPYSSSDRIASQADSSGRRDPELLSCARGLPSGSDARNWFLAVRAARRRAHGAAVHLDRRASQLWLPGSARPETTRPAPVVRSRMTAEAAKAPHQTAAGLSHASGPASSADLTAGQRAQVNVPGERARESALDTSPPANRTAAVSPMGGGAAHKDHGPLA
jgi:hypothetical protein